MFYRVRFYEYLVALGPDQWAVPLTYKDLADLLERVPA